MSAKIFKFVAHSQATAYLDLGWEMQMRRGRPSLEGTHHAQSGFLMVWPHDTPPVEPTFEDVPLAG